jgi:hypothetical protein
VFVPCALVCVVLDAALMPALSVFGHWPSVMFVLLAFTTLYASRAAALWSALLVGLYADAQVPAIFGAASGGLGAAGGSSGLYVFGPHMLACVIAVWAVLEIRESLFRRNVFTVAAAAFVLFVAQSLVFLAIAGLRVVFADPAPLWGAGSGARAFGHDIVDAVYTAIAAVPVAWVLIRTTEAWGFEEAGPRFGRG